MKAPLALALSLAAASAAAQRPPAAPPVDDRRPYDPYRVADYPILERQVAAGIRGVLYVGVKDESVGRYESHLWVPSGFKVGEYKFTDGVWDCWREQTTGRTRMQRRDTYPVFPLPAAGVPAAPFTVPPPLTPITPAITVPHAAGFSFKYPGLTPTAATTTGAPRAGRFGTTSSSDCKT